MLLNFDYDVQDDHYRHHSHACLRCCVTPSASGMVDAPPYTLLLMKVIQKLQKSSSSARLTCLLLPGESAAQKLPLLIAVHDCDHDGDDDDDDDFEYDVLLL
jgi:hypothetical protein